MECLNCNSELSEREYKFCSKCLNMLKKEHSEKYQTMPELDFEDYLDEFIRLEKERDQLSEDEFQD